MQTRKIISLICIAIAAATMWGCGFKNEKSIIKDSVREYVEPRLSVTEHYDFIGTSNRRDTVYLGVSRPCMGVIYTISDVRSGEKTRHYADVIFSNDYKTVIGFSELDSDPMQEVEHRIRKEFKKKLRDKILK